jgi:hypothetical protein
MVDPVAFEWFLRYPERGLSFDIMLEARRRTPRCCACASSSRHAASRRAAMPSRRPEHDRDGQRSWNTTGVARVVRWTADELMFRLRPS